MIHRIAPLAAAAALLSLSACTVAPASREAGPETPDETEPARPVAGDATPPVEPEGRGVVGMTRSSSPCAERVRAFGSEIRALATVMGEVTEAEVVEVARFPCDRGESDASCLGRARAAHGGDRDLDLALVSEGRVLRAVLRIDGVRKERTFRTPEAVEAFLRARAEAGREAVLEQIVAEPDPDARVVSVRRLRPLPRDERLGTASLMVAGDPSDLPPDLRERAARHHLAVTEVAPMGSMVRVEVTCR